MVGRHILNENSPLLTQSMRQEIAALGGKWPTSEIGSESIREALIPFERILVSVTGMERQGNNVFSFKSYFPADIRANAAFLSMYDHHGSKGPGFDLSKINDIVQFEDHEHNHVRDESDDEGDGSCNNRAAGQAGGEKVQTASKGRARKKEDSGMLGSFVKGFVGRG